MKNKSGLKPVALQITTQVQKNPLLVMYDLSKFRDVIESIFFVLFQISHLVNYASKFMT